MSQIFIFGASSVYGVGGENGGWADMVKRKVHHQMYSENGVGEKHEVYIFAKSGATVEFVLNNFQQQIDQYKKNGKVIALLSVGANNARAKDKPDDFVSTPKEFEKSIKKLINQLKSSVNNLICVGYTPVDETKTAPKPNPLSGGTSYFYNKRLTEFNTIFEKACKDLGVKFINIDIDPQEWKNKYLFRDGLHPNKNGHQYIFEKVWTEIEKII